MSLEGIRAIPDAFVLQVPLEELQAHQGKDTQAEDSEDGHISQLPHRVDQGSHDDLQSYGKVTEGEVPHRAQVCTLAVLTTHRCDTHTPGSSKPSFLSAPCDCPERQVGGACHPSHKSKQLRPGQCSSYNLKANT